MRIVQVTAEFAPIAKAGGMGEVVVGLTRELSRLGHDVDVILPKYDSIDLKKLSKVDLEVPDFKCGENGNLHANAMWSANVEGCRLHLLEVRHSSGYFHRGKIYGFEDDTRRFIYFCRAVMEYLSLKKEKIDILHLHDWHTALCAVLAREIFHLPIKGILITLHNVEYQGRCATWDLDAIGLNGKKLLAADKMQDDDPEYPKAINLLKGGLVYSDGINAVSNSYAKEILTSHAGFHLEKTLKRVKGKLTGIINGIDQTLWNPANDPHLAAHYSASDSLNEICDAKQKLRKALSNRFGLDPNRRPWIGGITRLVPQKGPELIEFAIQKTPSLGGTFILLGSSPNPKIQTQFESLKKHNAANRNIFLHFEYDEALAHEIYGALDFLLIPSHFEPCGLTQLIGMRYGVIPIARATGGLKDTIFDGENGLLFLEPTPKALNETLARAFDLFHNKASTFASLMMSGMKTDCSWKNPAQQYLRLYEKLALGDAVAI